jgi:Major Facilitator Superfamily
MPATRSAGRGRHNLGLALAVIATAQLMIVLDATIVNVALPHIQRALGFSGTGLEWVVNAYALSFGGLLLLGGRAGDLLGRRRVFIAGLLLFSAASLARWTVHRSGCGRASISCQDEPGKRTRRSFTYSPCLGEFLAGERGRVIARAGVRLNACHGGASPDLPAQSLQLSLQRIQFGTGNADLFGCFGAHVAPSFRRFRPKCRSLRPGRADPWLAAHDPG